MRSATQQVSEFQVDGVVQATRIAPAGKYFPAGRKRGV
jgi:hypothetical protein